MEHFGDKTLAAMLKVYNEFDAGIKFKFSSQLTMQRHIGDDVQLSNLFISAFDLIAVTDISVLGAELFKQ
jgi:2-phospho-L-lactate transferase/gluconeogenesis factor (CofD/UPF0052 family)